MRTLANSQQQPTVLPPSGVERWVKDRLLFNAIAEEVGGGPLNTADPESQQVLVEVQDQLTKAGEDLDIEVNPRYGAWSPKRGITPLVSGGLATPLDAGRVRRLLTGRTARPAAGPALDVAAGRAGPADRRRLGRRSPPPRRSRPPTATR